jgi:peptide/nickel transport system substrate-binding protein
MKTSTRLVRQGGASALALLIERKSVQDHIYGRTGVATGNFVNNPKKFVSKNTKWEFNFDKANKILTEAAGRRGRTASREGRQEAQIRLQTSINTRGRQKNQAIVKQAVPAAGIDIEVKAVTASVFFSSDVANPDTYPHFYCDLQMYTTTMTQPDPETFLLQFVSWEVATKENKWQGRNITRWTNKEADDASRLRNRARSGEAGGRTSSRSTILPATITRSSLSSTARPCRRSRASLRGAIASGWDSNFWDLHNWYKEG